MATFRSGNGGYIEVGATRLDVISWEVDTGSRTTENTHSGTSGYSNYEHVCFDASSTIEIPWDEVNQPDTDAGLVPGNKVTVKYYHGGAGGKFITLTNTLVEKLITTDNNSNDIVRARVTTKGGSITRTTT